VNRKTLGGAALLAAAVFLGREAVVWAFNRVLDALSSGVRGRVNFAALSWQNSLAVALAFAGLILVLWPKPKPAAVKAQSYRHLYDGARNVIQRVRAHRASRYFMRDRLEPVSDIVRAGDAILLSFAKAGFHVPEFDVPYNEQIAIGQEAYFASLIQLLGRGHIDEAKMASVPASQAAARAALLMNPQEWFSSF
jgi:hypothetical protein